MKLEDHKKQIDDFFNSHTPEQLKEMWDKYNYLSKSNNTVSLSDVISSLTVEDITKIVNAFTDINIPIEAVKEEIELNYL